MTSPTRLVLILTLALPALAACGDDPVRAEIEARNAAYEARAAPPTGPMVLPDADPLAAAQLLACTPERRDYPVDREHCEAASARLDAQREAARRP